jgi:hypothetical protein
MCADRDDHRLVAPDAVGVGRDLGQAGRRGHVGVGRRIAGGRAVERLAGRAEQLDQRQLGHRVQLPEVADHLLEGRISNWPPKVV